MKDLESNHQFELHFKGCGNIWGFWVGELNHSGTQQEEEKACSHEDNLLSVKWRSYLLRFEQGVVKVQGIMLHLEQATWELLGGGQGMGQLLWVMQRSPCLLLGWLHSERARVWRLQPHSPPLWPLASALHWLKPTRDQNPREVIVVLTGQAPEPREG